MPPKYLSPDERVKALARAFDIVNALSFPGGAAEVVIELKNIIALVNNSIADDMKQASETCPSECSIAPALE